MKPLITSELTLTGITGQLGAPVRQMLIREVGTNGNKRKPVTADLRYASFGMFTVLTHALGTVFAAFLVFFSSTGCKLGDRVSVVEHPAGSVEFSFLP